ncbi:MAG: prepilin-type N-terminal cleavage/methylation domain-containing protein [Pseudomonadota bacterium]
MSVTQRGFTLIEVMVSITILSLVMLLTVSGLRTLASSQTRVEAKAERNDELRLVSTFLRDLLGSSVSPGPIISLSLGGGSRPDTYFEALRNSFVWKAPMTMGESAGGRFLLRLSREDSALVLRWLPDEENVQFPEWNKATPKTLLDDITTFETAYRGERAGPWSAAWPAQLTPRWVRIRIQKDERYWPDIVIDLAR